MSAPTLPNGPRLKKSETLEIRLPYPTKLAFMQSCRAEGRSASEALRQFIEGRLDAPALPRPAGRRVLHLVAGALVAAAVGAVAAPSLALSPLSRPSPRDAFARLDANHDGKVTYAEFRAAYSAG
ncbi:MAG TPA: EF-hand domain-containing protein, partial [Phenylobacterium sp.]